MKSCHRTLSVLLLSGATWLVAEPAPAPGAATPPAPVPVGQAPAPVDASPQSVTAPEAVPPVAPVPSDQELEKLVAPLALYPDPLVALILPASTSPSDIVLASRYLKANPQATAFDNQAWDDAVKLLARYPTLVAWMDENLEWTKQLGEAFMQQPAAVMTAIQRVRARAKASGVLVDTPQQTVVVEEEDIRIVPASPDVIYVPTYDPAILYVGGIYARPATYLTFGIGFPVGYWLAYDCDWRFRTVRYVHSPHRSHYWTSYHRPAVSVSVAWCAPDRFERPQWRAWQPSYRPREVSARRAPAVATVNYSSAPSRRDSSARYAPPASSPAPRYSDRGRVSNVASTSVETTRSAPPPNPADRGPDSRDRSRDSYRPPQSRSESTRTSTPPSQSTRTREYQAPQASTAPSRNYSGPVASESRASAPRTSTPSVSAPPTRSEGYRQESSSSSRASSPPPAASRGDRQAGDNRGTSRDRD